ncbi:MAG: tetratricopeptide repeat protein [Phycisphaerales bacterium]|nr:tetratricopeptide repeat protein [Phycisphaerales bacterium]
MHTQRINRLGAILVLTAMGLITSSGVAGTAMSFDEPATMQEAGAFVQAESWEEAINAYRSIVKADSSNAQAQFMLGYVLHASGDIDNAIMAHKKATQMPAVASMAFYNLGCAYALKGETNKAFDALGTSIALGTRDEPQFKSDPDLVSLRSDERWEPMVGSIEQLNKAEVALHFWVGSWDCYSSSDGTLSGYNTLSFTVGKNVIHESWVSVGQPYKGESWNTFNRETNEWEQTWVDTTGSLLHISAPAGSNEYEGLMFEGKSIVPGKKPALSRMHVRPIDEGRVLQTGFASSDGGKSWTQQYEFVYVPEGEEFVFESKDED